MATKDDEYRFTIFDGKVYKATDLNGKSDPYCKVYLIRKNDKGEDEPQQLLFKTAVCKNTLEPKWNIAEIIPLKSGPGEINSAILELWDQDLIKDELIGSVRISIAALGFGFPYTLEIMNYRQFSTKHILLNKNKDHVAEINLIVCRMGDRD